MSEPKEPTAYERWQELKARGPQGAFLAASFFTNNRHAINKSRPPEGPAAKKEPTAEQLAQQEAQHAARDERRAKYSEVYEGVYGKGKAELEAQLARELNQVNPGSPAEQALKIGHVGKLAELRKQGDAAVRSYQEEEHRLSVQAGRQQAEQMVRDNAARAEQERQAAEKEAPARAEAAEQAANFSRWGV